LRISAGSTGSGWRQVYIALVEPQETTELVQHVADHLGLHLTTPTAYYLTRTTILAALSSLEGAGKVKVTVRANRLVWSRTEHRTRNP